MISLIEYGRSLAGLVRKGEDNRWEKEVYDPKVRIIPFHALNKNRER